MSALLEDFVAAPAPARTVESWRRTPFAAFGLDKLTAAPARQGAFKLGQAPLGAELRELQPAQAEGFWGSADHLKLELANRAFWKGGAFVHVPKGVRVTEPIRLPFEAEGPFSFPRALVVLDEGAEATIVEEHRGDAGTSVAYSKVVVGANARAHVVYQQELGAEAKHFWSQKCVLAANAHLTHTSLVLGGSVHKSELEIELAGQGARSELFGMTLGRGQQHFDTFTKQWHAAPRTSSDLTFRSALRDKSRAVYTGLIRIDEKARNVEAYQSDHNLLLSNGARADSTPVLEILNDDVACKHAATAGPLDAEELFYLAARGFGEEDARRTLVMGFFEPVLRKLPDASERERLAAQIEASL